jgi:hypothetical protein
MRRLPILQTGAAIALLLATGCQSGSGSLSSYGATASAPASGVPASCERTCNPEYDSCMDRFGGTGATSTTTSLSPNDVCPDQLKSCLRRCPP